MRFKLIAGALLAGCALGNPIGYDASAQKPAAQGKPEPAKPLEPSELSRIRESLESIAAAQQAERDRREAEQDDTTAKDDLQAQRDMAFWAQAMFFATLASVALGAGSLWALIWTFGEQRKLTKAETRAYLELVGGRVTVWPGWRGQKLFIGLRNAGETPASKVRVIGVCKTDPGAIDGNELGEVSETKFEISLDRSLAAHGSDVLEWHFDADVSFLIDNVPRVSGTDKCRMAMIVFKGAVFYEDAFRDAHELPFVLNTAFLSSDPNLPAVLAGAGPENY